MLVAFLKLDEKEVTAIVLTGCISKQEKKAGLLRDLTEEGRDQAIELAEILEQLYIFTNIIQGKNKIYFVVFIDY